MRIAVIIPVRNEEESVGTLLDALLRQSFSPTEIVITDGGSTDSTALIIQAYIDRGAPILLTRTTGALPGRARNLAAARSSSEWLAFTDAGTKPSKEWLASLAEAAATDPSVDVVYGSFEPVTSTFFKECAAIAYVSPPAEIDGILLRTRSIASALMRRSVWEAVGGFPEDLRSAEDLLFMNKIEEAGFRTTYAPQALVRWDLQPNVWRTFKRVVVYARNNIRAGLWGQWQRPVFGRYGLLALTLLPAFFLGRSWLLVSLTLFLMLLSARALAAIYHNRRSYPASAGRNLARLLVLVPLIAVLDLGLIAGSIHWFLTDKLRLGTDSIRVGHGT